MLDELMGKTWQERLYLSMSSLEAWQKITGKELTLKKRSQSSSLKALALCFCITMSVRILMWVFFYNGRVIHLGIRGVQYIPLEYLTSGFKKVSFYK